MTKYTSRPAQEMLDEFMLDPEFKKRWDSRAPQRALTQALIDTRIQRKLSQRKLASRIGIKQPALARLERGRITASFATLCRVAEGLGKRIEVRLVDT